MRRIGIGSAVLALGALLLFTLVHFPKADTSAAAGVAALSDNPPQTVSATGVAQVSAAPSPQMTLNIGIQERSVGTDLQAALKAVQDKVAAIRAALEKAGVPAADIRSTSFSVSVLQSPPQPRVAEPAPVPVPQGYMVHANLQAETSSAEQLAAAMQAAVQAGATSVSSMSKGGPQAPPPDAAALAAAIKAATEQARAAAQASAQAAGLALGSIRGTQVHAPAFSYQGPGSSQWRIEVTVTYHVSAPAQG